MRAFARKSRISSASIDIRVPGHGDIVSNRHHHEDVFVALRAAFDSTVRQLEDIVRERRGEVKAHEGRARHRPAQP